MKQLLYGKKKVVNLNSVVISEEITKSEERKLLRSFNYNY